jgi:CDP-paratose synthetase
MNILISGGSGYLGSALAKDFIEEGNRVCIPLRSQSSTIRLTDIEDFCTIKRYSSVSELEKIVLDFKPDIIIHTACLYGRNGESNAKLIEANLLFGMELLEISERLLKPVKFINTDTCLEASLNSYALSKSQFAHWGRLIVNKKSSNLTFLNIRLQQFYGPGDDKTKLPGHILHSCFSNVTNLKLTSGNQLRDFIYIEDVLAAFLVVVKNIESFEQYSEIELGTGNSITVKEFVQTVHSLLGSSTNLLFGAIPSRDNEPEECVADLNVLLGLGWEPNFSLVDGLTKTIKLEFNRGQMI